MLRAVDPPQVRETQHSFFEVWRAAYDLNPEYHVQRFRVLQEANRLGYARNQRLPELNLKGSYGLNGLGETPGDSWNDIEMGGFPSWNVGVELRVPLAGGIKTGNDLAAARLRYQSSQLTLREVETQMVNSLDTALHKIQSARESVRGYRTVQGFNQSVFDSSLARLEVGKVDSRRVLEIEAELLEARNSVAEALVQFERAELELELMQGAVLKNRSLDLPQRELSARTSQLLRRAGLNDVRVQEVVRQIQLDSSRSPNPSTLVETPAQIKARQALNEKLAGMSSGNDLSSAGEPTTPAPSSGR
jgi:outer membrane protein TolC